MPGAALMVDLAFADVSYAEEPNGNGMVYTTAPSAEGHRRHGSGKVCKKRNLACYPD